MDTKKYSAKEQIYDLMRLGLAHQTISEVQMGFLISKKILEILEENAGQMKENISHFLRYSPYPVVISEELLKADEADYQMLDTTNCPTTEDIFEYIAPFDERQAQQGDTKRDQYRALHQAIRINRQMAASLIMQTNPALTTEESVMEERIERSAEAIATFFAEEKSAEMKAGFIYTLLYNSIALPFATVFPGEEDVWPRDEIVSLIRKSDLDSTVIAKIEGFYKDMHLSPSRTASLLPDSISFAIKEIAKDHPEFRAVIDAPAFKKVMTVITSALYFHAFRLGSEFAQMRNHTVADVKNLVDQRSQEKDMALLIETTEMFNLDYNLSIIEHSGNAGAQESMKKFLENRGNERLLARFQTWEKAQKQNTKKEKEKKKVTGRGI
ncbi:MAG: hypothetical protein Q8O83_02225 [bacterium]|nr:hypothetical protein [bacterium]